MSGRDGCKTKKAWPLMHGAVSTVLYIQDMSLSLAHIVLHFAFVYVALLVANKQAGPDVKCKAMLMTHQQIGGQNHNTQLANKFFRNAMKVSLPGNDTNK